MHLQLASDLQHAAIMPASQQHTRRSHHRRQRSAAAQMQQRIAAGPYSYMCTVYSTVSASLIGRKQPPQTAIAGAGSSSRRRRQQQAAAVRHMQGRCVRAGGGGAGGRSASRKWCSGHHGAGSERHSAKAKTRTCSRPSPHASKVRSTGLLTLLCSHHALCASSSSTIIVALA